MEQNNTMKWPTKLYFTVLCHSK